MKNFWKRQEVSYFNSLYEKMLNRVDKYGNPRYKPEDVFNILNFKYKAVFGKLRYKNFYSFKSSRNAYLR